MGSTARPLRAPVGGEHDGAVTADPPEAEAPLPLTQGAVVGAQVALHPAVGAEVPPAGGSGRSHGRDDPAAGPKGQAGCSRNGYRSVTSTAAPVTSPRFRRARAALASARGKHVGHGVHRDLRRQVEELLGVAPGGVGHAADLALPPQVPVGELGDAVEVDGVDRHHPAPVQGPQGGDHDLADRGEGDRRVEGHRGRLVVGPRPHRPHLEGAALLGRRAGGDEHLATPVHAPPGWRGAPRRRTRRGPRRSPGRMPETRSER